MISKQLVKFVKSLKLKKYRKNAAAFTVEGAKNVVELLKSDYTLLHLFVTEKFLALHADLVDSLPETIICRQKDLEEMGSFETNEYALAVAAMKTLPEAVKREPLILALDSINDPGNLGTIIRIADWYGIRQIIASPESADFYNPKVINATMGSFTRISINYMELEDFFNSFNDYTIYGAFLNGLDVHQVQFTDPAIIVLGNESHGISMKLDPYIKNKLTRPRIGQAESLNVAVSAAILCDNYFRSKH